MPHLTKVYNERFVVQRRLGGGGFCEVVMAMDSEKMDICALKVLDRNKPIFQKGKEDVIERKLRTFMRREAEVLAALSHEHIIKFFEFVEDDRECFLVLEVVSGGELYDRIVTEGKLEEAEAREIIKQLVDAVIYIHANGFVHRDIKPENILMEKEHRGIPMIKLADFGLSRHLASKMFTNCGTIDYCAPELLLNRVEKKGYGREVDTWSIGVVVYVCLSGYQPFMSENHNEEDLKTEIVLGKYKFHRQYWHGVSTSAKRFIASVLKVNPENRALLESLCSHPWLTKGLTKDNIANSASVSIRSE